MKKTSTSPARALFKFGIRQTIKGAVILGILGGILVSVQGLGYAATYPDQKARDQFAASLAGAPGLGILYGEAKNMATPASYTVYRAVAVMGLITSVWALLTTTRLLRGQEEDGRWETITAGSTTSRKASLLIMSGFTVSIFVAFSIMTAMTALMGLAPDVSLSPGTSALIVLAIFLPALLFTAVGYFISQLSFSRRRAMLYGLVPLFIFFILRSVGNTVSDLYFLKDFTPFGWADMMSPVIDPKPEWIWPFIPLVPIIGAVAAYLVGKRDVGGSLIPESDTVKSRFFLLQNPLALTLRQNLFNATIWCLSILAMSGIITTVTNVAADALTDSPNLTSAITQLSGTSNDLKAAFIGAGMVFIVIALLIMAAVNLAGVRKDEAKNYLDNLLVQPVRRASWLTMRLCVITVTFILITLLATYFTWTIAEGQGISINLGNFLLVGLALTGTVVFTLGVGTLLYGIWPRIAAASMYVILGWSFLIDLVGSAVKLDDFIVKTSLFHYMSLSPNDAPDWKTFYWLIVLGVIMAIVGIFSFTKRDIISE
jgi:ABC-2 type transport system permease protein